MRKYSDKKPARRELKKLKRKDNLLIQGDISLDESVIDSKYKEWNVADIGLSKEGFTMMYHSFQNLDKAKPVTFANKKSEEFLKKKYGITDDDI